MTYFRMSAIASGFGFLMIFLIVLTLIMNPKNVSDGRPANFPIRTFADIQKCHDAKGVVQREPVFLSPEMRIFCNFRN